VGGVDARRLPSSAGVVRCGAHRLSFGWRAGWRWTAVVHRGAIHSGPQLSTELSSGVGRPGFGVEPTGERVVFDGKYVTAAGVSAGS
jgi:hypothetical protein